MTTAQGIIIGVLALATGFLAGRWLREHHFREGTEMIAKTDTTSKRDTNIYRFPDIFLEVTISDAQITIPADSVQILDDSLIVLPIQQRHYKSDDYEAWVSGYNPRLDSLCVFPETKYITVTKGIPTEKTIKNSISLFAEPTWSGSFHTPVGVEYSRHIKPWFSIGARAGYDTISNNYLLGATARISFGW